MHTVRLTRARRQARRVDTIGGYRLVRKLGEGARAEVWLGHVNATVGMRGDGVCAIKTYRSDVEVADIDREIEALARCSSPHIVELQDLATGQDGRPCLVLGRLTGGSLAQLLGRRRSLAAGEVVTALAPVATALAELHRVGVAHGGVAPESIMLDARGTPVLVGFGRAGLVGGFPVDPEGQSLTIAQREAEPAIGADLSSLLELVLVMLDRVDHSPAVGALTDWLRQAARDSHTIDELTDGLYGLATASPIRTDAAAPGQSPVVHVPFPMRAALPAIDPSVGSAPSGGSLGSVAARVGLGLVEQGPSDLVRSRLVPILARVTGARVRTPVWIAGGAGVVALVCALAVVPTVGSARGVGTPAATRGAIIPSSAPATVTTARPSAALTGDDPVAAATALITARAACITQRSVGCLDSVDQADSAALDADQFFLRELQGGGTIKDRRLDGSQPTLVERLGDSAIVGLGPPTAPSTYAQSVLVVKVDAGWRIRDLTTGVSP